MRGAGAARKCFEYTSYYLYPQGENNNKENKLGTAQTVCSAEVLSVVKLQQYMRCVIIVYMYIIICKYITVPTVCHCYGTRLKIETSSFYALAPEFQNGPLAWYNITYHHILLCATRDMSGILLCAF